MRRCPSDLRLECWLLGVGRARLASHLGLCRDCRWRVAGMRRDGETFLREVYPATRERILARTLADGRHRPR